MSGETPVPEIMALIASAPWREAVTYRDTWPHEYDAYTFSSINVRRDGFIHDAPEHLEQTRAWMLDMLPRLQHVFDPRLARIVPGLAEADGA